MARVSRRGFLGLFAAAPAAAVVAPRVAADLPSDEALLVPHINANGGVSWTALGSNHTRSLSAGSMPSHTHTLSNGPRR